jgi:hypothetical protein
MAKAPNLSVALVIGAASGIDQKLAIYWLKTSIS